MATAYIDHHLALLAHLRTILIALGDAEQVPEDNHALFIERFDELLAELPYQPESAMHLGQELIVQVFHRYPQIAHLVPRDLRYGCSAATACTTCPTRRSTCTSSSTNVALPPKNRAKRSTGSRKSSCSPCPTAARATDTAVPLPPGGGGIDQADAQTKKAPS